MDSRFNKWDIVKIRNPSDVAPIKGLKVVEKNAYFHLVYKIPVKISNKKKVEEITLKIDDRFINGMEFYVNKKDSVYSLIGCRVLSLVPTKETTIQIPRAAWISFSLPEEFLIPTGKRILDVRDMNNVNYHEEITEMCKRNKYILISRMTKNSKIQKFPNSIDNIRKYSLRYFPGNKANLKDVVYNMLTTMNCNSHKWASLYCHYCNSSESFLYISAKRYFRKDGSMTYKCSYCGRTNFVVLDFIKDPDGIFTSSATNEHRIEKTGK